MLPVPRRGQSAERAVRPNRDAPDGPACRRCSTGAGSLPACLRDLRCDGGAVRRPPVQPSMRRSLRRSRCPDPARIGPLRLRQTSGGARVFLLTEPPPDPPHATSSRDAASSAAALRDEFTSISPRNRIGALGHNLPARVQDLLRVGPGSECGCGDVVRGCGVARGFHISRVGLADRTPASIGLRDCVCVYGCRPKRIAIQLLGDRVSGMQRRRQQDRHRHGHRVGAVLCRRAEGDATRAARRTAAGREGKDDDGASDQSAQWGRSVLRSSGRAH